MSLSTSAQKAEIESEIEAWEEKAKEGLLFNDNDLKGLSNSLRFVVSTANQAALKKLGITTSSTASTMENCRLMKVRSAQL